MKRSLCFSVTALAAAIVSMPALGVDLFTDVDGSAANFDTGVSTGLTDIRFGFDYGNFDIFGDGFTTGSIAEAPNGAGLAAGAATTGIFISVNNDSIAQGGTGAAAAAGVFAKNLNVGEGTANPNFKMTVDVFTSVATGWDYGAPRGIEVNGTTNYTYIGALYENTDMTVQGTNPGAQGNPGGIGVAATGDGGSGSDWYSVINGRTYESRDSAPDTTGTAYQGIPSGLVSDHINQAFVDAGTSGLGVTPLQFNNTDNASFVSPIPGSEALFDDATAGTFKEYWREQFPAHNDPLHYTSSQAGTPLANDTIQAGTTPHNQWSTHTVSVVDGVFYYAINDIPVMELAINDDPNSPDQTIFDNITAAGTIMLGFWDRFSSISNDPEGANFVVYDNVKVESVNSGDKLFDLTNFLETNGYIAAATGTIAGDYNDNGLVEQGDLDLVLLNWGTSGTPAGWVNEVPVGIVDQAELDGVLLNWGNTSEPAGSAVPEPATAALLGLGALAMLRRRAA